MLNLRHYIDTSANGANQDWQVNFGPTAYEAVLRGSGDTSYLSSSTGADVSDFVCGSGPAPPLGFVAAVIVRLRARTTDTTGGPQIKLDLLRSGAPVGAGVTFTYTNTNWQDQELRYVADPATAARFLSSGLGALGARVTTATAPTTGALRVSALWLEVEWVRSPEAYDPQTTSTPDALLGDMAWSTTGTQTASAATGELVIQDTSAADWREYTRSILEYGSDYITEVAARLRVSTTAPGTAFIFRIARLLDGAYDIDLCAFQEGTTPYIGLISGSADRSDPTAYLATYQLDVTTTHHYRLVVDRFGDPGGSLNVQVLVDYADMPVMEVLYTKFSTTATTELRFGSGDAALLSGLSTATVDFFEWWHYDRTGDWRYWYTIATGTNDVLINTADPFIVKPITITPPGIQTGQSERCCALVVSDLLEECSVRTYFPVPSGAGTYDLTVDYRIDTFSENAKVSVQRTSDHYYWNDGGSVWQAAATDVTLPYAPTRTRTTFMTGITTATPDQLIIKFRNDVGAALPHTVYLYKTDLRD